MGVLWKIKVRAQVALEVIIAVTVMIMFVAFMGQFIEWEVRDINRRINAYKDARNRRVYGRQFGDISVDVYSGSSFYNFYRGN